MKRMCFGTFATIFSRCKASVTNQKDLIGSMLLSVNPDYDITYDDGATSALATGRKNVSDNILLYLDDVEPKELAEAFKSSITPKLDYNKRANIILAIKDVLAADSEIADTTPVELVNGFSKSDVILRSEFVFEEFVVGVFLYVLKYTKNDKQEKNVKEISDAYVKSFDGRRSEISFIDSYSLRNGDEIKTIAADAHVMDLMAEQRGRCPNCGKTIQSATSTIVKIDKSADMLLCVECAALAQNSDELRAELAEKKSSSREQYNARDAIAMNKLSDDVRELLQVISVGEPLSQSALRMSPLKVERKVTEKQLRRKILNNVVDGMYEMVNEAIEELAAQNKINVKNFRKTIRRMFEDASDQTDNQSTIFNELVKYLYARAGMKHFEACEILISYFVQSCEVFNEITE